MRGLKDDESDGGYHLKAEVGENMAKSHISVIWATVQSVFSSLHGRGAPGGGAEVVGAGGGGRQPRVRGMRRNRSMVWRRREQGRVQERCEVRLLLAVTALPITRPSSSIHSSSM